MMPAVPEYINNAPDLIRLHILGRTTLTLSSKTRSPPTTRTARRIRRMGRATRGWIQGLPGFPITWEHGGFGGGGEGELREGLWAALCATHWSTAVHHSACEQAEYRRSIAAAYCRRDRRDNLLVIVIVIVYPIRPHCYNSLLATYGAYLLHDGLLTLGD